MKTSSYSEQQGSLKFVSSLFTYSLPLLEIKSYYLAFPLINLHIYLF